MNVYEVLGLTPAASLAEAERAYHQLMRIHHPDLHQGAPPSDLAAAQSRTMALNASIRMIRADHDRERPGVADNDWARFVSMYSDDEPRPAVACPLCGTLFSSAPLLRAHVTYEHEMHFAGAGAAPRRRRRRTRLPLFTLWTLLPLNVLAALLAVAVVDVWVHDWWISMWTFCLALAPSAVRALDHRP